MESLWEVINQTITAQGDIHALKTSCNKGITLDVDELLTQPHSAKKNTDLEYINTLNGLQCLRAIPF